MSLVSYRPPLLFARGCMWRHMRYTRTSYIASHRYISLCRTQYQQQKQKLTSGKNKESASPRPPQLPPRDKSSAHIGPITWKSLVIVTCVGGVVIYFVRQEVNKKEREMNKVETIGKMDVGGPWEGLVNNKGITVSSKDYLGQWLFLYFGFTHCPDICPDELEKIVKAVKTIDSNPDYPNIQPMFITIDPGRDTPQAIDTYIKDFSPKLIGLTGDRDKVSQVARLYRIYQSEGPKDEDNDYIVDHSIITYLVNPDGECIAFFTKSQSDTMVANTTMIQMKHYQMQNPTTKSA